MVAKVARGSMEAMRGGEKRHSVSVGHPLLVRHMDIPHTREELMRQMNALLMDSHRCSNASGSSLRKDPILLYRNESNGHMIAINTDTQLQHMVHRYKRYAVKRKEWSNEYKWEHLTFHTPYHTHTLHITHTHTISHTHTITHTHHHTHIHTYHI